MSFEKFSSEYYAIINRELESYLSGCIQDAKGESGFIEYIYGLIKESTMQGGKRLRPIALIMAYFASGGKDKKNIILPAIASELHQTYSLILDDIMDEDEMRRNNLSAYKKIKDFYLNNFSEENYRGSLFDRKSSRFTVSQALMAGNIAAILSKKAILASSFSDKMKTEAFSLIEKYDESIYHGQMTDVLMEYKEKTTEEEYLFMIMRKTSALFSMALELGAMFAGADSKKRESFKKFGMASAAAFQIRDDLLDLTGGKGHDIGSDIKKGKKTLLYIKMMEKADTAMKKTINGAFGNFAAPDAQIKKIISFMHDTGAISYSEKLASDYAGQASAALSDLRLDIYYSELFSGLNDFMINRKS